MRIKKLFIILIFFSLVLLPVTPALAQAVTEDYIADQLMCQCSCVLVLSECHCDQPDGAVEMKAVVSEQLAQGDSQQEILGYFVARYGAQVLAPEPAPASEQASNPVPWIWALLGISAVGAVIYLTRKKRVRGKSR